MGLKTWLRLKQPPDRPPPIIQQYADELGGQERARGILRLLTPQRAIGLEKVRVGCDNDGGYVMLDDFADISTAVSCGVGINWSWDHDIMMRGIAVRQFDQAAQPHADHGPLVECRALRVSGSPGAGRVTLDAIASELNAGPATALLKIDIEGEEWDALAAVGDSSLSPFAQIVIEFHDMGALGAPDRLSKCQAVIEKLSRQFQSVHVHGNNHRPFVSIFNIAIPDVLEVTFASRCRYRFTSTTETFPTALDMPNKAFSADLWLGTFSY
jgi:hypothetical protein